MLLAVYGLAPVTTAHADSTAGVFVATQGRVVDTRSGVGGYGTPFAAGETRTFQVTGLAGVPTSGVSAVSVTLTAVNASGSGYLSSVRRRHTHRDSAELQHG